MTVKLFERNNSIYAQKNTSKLIVFNKKGRGNLALSKDRAVRRTDFSTEKSGFKRVTDGDY